jgi:hypothetical protein
LGGRSSCALSVAATNSAAHGRPRPEANGSNLVAPLRRLPIPQPVSLGTPHRRILQRCALSKSRLGQ